jgi:hypothetical protein
MAEDLAVNAFAAAARGLPSLVPLALGSVIADSAARGPFSRWVQGWGGTPEEHPRIKRRRTGRNFWQVGDDLLSTRTALTRTLEKAQPKIHRIQSFPSTEPIRQRKLWRLYRRMKKTRPVKKFRRFRRKAYRKRK